jgi:molecular chaperone DnaK
MIGGDPRVRRVVGIDLGTSNSVVATIDRDGAPRIITSAAGGTTTPSMVAFLSEDGAPGRVEVGEAAAAFALTHPEATVFGVKRLLGRRFDEPEVQQLAATLPYEIVAAPNGDAWIGIHGLVVSPQEVAALILGHMRAVAEAHFGGEVREAVITVPAYFDNQQRQATKDAAAIAGLDVRRLLNEPTAAALGYGAHMGVGRRFAVCDLGGGTFDVSIVNVEDGVFEVISTHGDAFLGGDDVDRAIIENLVREVRASHGIDLSTDSLALQKLKAEAQRAKHALSFTPEAELYLPSLTTLPSGRPLDYGRRLRRDELELWAAPTLRRLEAPCREALVRCGLAARDIDEVILVGGMTRMPAVRRRLATTFGREPAQVDNPDEIVAVGAAVQCAILDGTIEGVVLLDVTSRGIALGVGDGPCQPVLPRNATIPNREHRILATASDAQDELAFDVYEGDSPSAADNRHLARFVAGPLAPAPAGDVLVLVELTVDVDGILRLSASELATAERIELRLVASAGLSRAEVRRLAASLAESRR